MNHSKPWMLKLMMPTGNFEEINIYFNSANDTL